MTNFRLTAYVVVVAGNKYMKLAMADAKVDDTGRLSSPWLNGSVHHSCQLRFRYYIKNCYTCQLSVFLRTDTNFTSLWKTTDATYWFQDSPNINVPCTRRRYQVLCMYYELEFTLAFTTG